MLTKTDYEKFSKQAEKYLAKCGKKCEELSLKEVKEFADFANKVAGFCVGRRGAINAMPFINQI